MYCRIAEAASSTSVGILEYFPQGLRLKVSLWEVIPLRMVNQPSWFGRLGFLWTTIFTFSGVYPKGCITKRSCRIPLLGRGYWVSSKYATSKGSLRFPTIHGKADSRRFVASTISGPPGSVKAFFRLRVPGCSRLIMVVSGASFLLD